MREEGPSKLVHNERLKLRATALNGLAVASIVAGFITPLAALSFGLSAPIYGVSFAAIAAIAWLAGGIALHSAATWLLKGLQE